MMSYEDLDFTAEEIKLGENSVEIIGHIDEGAVGKDEDGSVFLIFGADNVNMPIGAREHRDSGKKLEELPEQLIAKIMRNARSMNLALKLEVSEDGKERRISAMESKS